MTDQVKMEELLPTNLAWQDATIQALSDRVDADKVKELPSQTFGAAAPAPHLGRPLRPRSPSMEAAHIGENLGPTCLSSFRRRLLRASR